MLTDNRYRLKQNYEKIKTDLENNDCWDGRTEWGVGKFTYLKINALKNSDYKYEVITDSGYIISAKCNTLYTALLMVQTFERIHTEIYQKISWPYCWDDELPKLLEDLS